MEMALSHFTAHIRKTTLSRRCFFCGQSSSEGKRYVSPTDLQQILQLHIDGELALPSHIHDCLLELAAVDFDEVCMRNALLSDPDTEHDDVETLFRPRTRKRLGGIPLCWRNCYLASAYFAFKHVPLSGEHNNNHGIIRDSPFDLGYMFYDTTKYDELLESKVDYIKQLFQTEASDLIADMHICRSPIKSFRHKVRFAILQTDSGHDLNNGESGSSGLVRYAMWGDGWPSVHVDDLPIASEVIRVVMRLLRDALNDVITASSSPDSSCQWSTESQPETASKIASAVLRRNLCAVHFLSTTSGHCIVKLLYGKTSGPTRGDETIAGGTDDTYSAAASPRLHTEREWCESAVVIRAVITDRLAAQQTADAAAVRVRSVSLCMQGKKMRFLLGHDSVEEQFTLADGRCLRYLHSIDGFSNPNAAVNTKCLNWLCDAVKECIAPAVRATGKRNEGGRAVTNGREVMCNLLEMYCGMGNHTMALAGFVDHVVGVDINKSLCAAARQSAALNAVHNVTFVAADSAKFAEGVLRRRTYEDRSSSGDSGRVFEFDAVLVDPPRCGLDAYTCRLVCNYRHILYISCSPSSLKRDLAQILKTHTIKLFAVFDQFAYTPHVECGVYLTLSLD